MRISDWSSDVCSSDLTIGSAGKFAPDLVHLRPLWRAVDAMMTATRAGPDLTAQLAKLKAVAFLLDFDGDLASLQQMWRTEDGVRPADIRAYVPDCPLVHGDVLALRSEGRCVGKGWVGTLRLRLLPG